MSEQTTESVRVPPVRPLSSISQLVDRLKCSRLQDDLPTTASVEPRTRLRRPHRPKAVNFTDEEACWINEAAAAVVTGSPSSPSTTASPATCDSGNEDSSEAWVRRCSRFFWLLILYVLARTRTTARETSEPSAHVHLSLKRAVACSAAT